MPGLCLAVNKNYLQATDELRVALKQDPAIAGNRKRVGSRLSGAWPKTGSLQLLTELTNSGSKDGELYFRLAQLQIELRSAQAAISTLQTAIRLDPMNATYHQELAEAYRQNAQPPDAERETQQSATLEALVAISHPSGSGN